jgi:uncharacterized protein (TIGR00255 family)
MIKSMTGFGSVSIENESVSISVEAKSINSKSQDFSFKLPRVFQDKENEVRNLMAQVLERGKVSINIEFTRKGSEKPKLTVNPSLFKAYYEDIYKNAVSVGADTSDIVKVVLGLPEVFDVDKIDKEIEKEWEAVYSCIKQAIEKCDNFRKAEGNVLEKQLESYIKTIENRLEKISEQDPQRIAKVREKLTQRVDEFIKNGKIDASRFEQELIYYIEKLDITEEKVRLKTHLEYFIETMEKPDANGKKLGFISQEIGREINTIGSKANDAVIQKWVVEMKEELEKIKEQSLNVL